MQGSSWHYEYHSKYVEENKTGREVVCKWYSDGHCDFKASSCTGGGFCKWYAERTGAIIEEEKRTVKKNVYEDDDDRRKKKTMYRGKKKDIQDLRAYNREQRKKEKKNAPKKEENPWDKIARPDYKRFDP